MQLVQRQATITLRVDVSHESVQRLASIAALHQAQVHARQAVAYERTRFGGEGVEEAGEALRASPVSFVAVAGQPAPPALALAPPAEKLLLIDGPVAIDIKQPLEVLEVAVARGGVLHLVTERAQLRIGKNPALRHVILAEDERGHVVPARRRLRKHRPRCGHLS